MAGRNYLLVIVMLSSALASFTLQAAILRLATTTSVENSGLLKILLPSFEQQSGYKVETRVTGSGRALRLARTGQSDLVWVHAPDAEKLFIEEGFGIARVPVMSNEFILVGPANDPANVRESENILDALKRISSRKALFVSRGDDSGTHKLELSLWNRVPLSPELAPWYFDLGECMSDTLAEASEMEAYTLTDTATWLANKNHLALANLYGGDSILHNPYSVIAVNQNKFPDVNYPGARQFIEWLTSSSTQRMIGQYKVDGEALFEPVIDVEKR